MFNQSNKLKLGTIIYQFENKN